MMEFCAGVLPPNMWLAVASPPGGLVACLLWFAFYFFYYVHESCNWDMVGIISCLQGYLQPMNGAVWARFWFQCWVSLMILRKSDAGGSCVILEPPCLIISPDKTGRNTREVKKFFPELLGSSQISKQCGGARGGTFVNTLAQHERRSFQTWILEKGFPPCIFLPIQPLSLSSLWVLRLHPLPRRVPMPPHRSKRSHSVPFSCLPGRTSKENRFQQRRWDSWRLRHSLILQWLRSHWFTCAGTCHPCEV